MTDEEKALAVLRSHRVTLCYDKAESKQPKEISNEAPVEEMLLYKTLLELPS